MTTVVDRGELSKPVIRRRALPTSCIGSLAAVARVRESSEFTLDGPAVHGGSASRFRTAGVGAGVRARGSEARLTGVVQDTGARCPAFSLVKDAGVRIETVWIRNAGDAGTTVA